MIFYGDMYTTSVYRCINFQFLIPIFEHILIDFSLFLLLNSCKNKTPSAKIMGQIFPDADPSKEFFKCKT